MDQYSLRLFLELTEDLHFGKASMRCNVSPSALSRTIRRLEEEVGQPPSYGIIKYRDQTYAVEYTAQLRAQLLSTLDEMRQDLSADDVGPSHTNPNRCRSCGYRDECEERLA